MIHIIETPDVTLTYTTDEPGTIQGIRAEWSETMTAASEESRTDALCLAVEIIPEYARALESMSSVEAYGFISKAVVPSISECGADMDALTMKLYEAKATMDVWTHANRDGPPDGGLGGMS